jgi:hypothetical protein
LKVYKRGKKTNEKKKKKEIMTKFENPKTKILDRRI